MGLGIPNDKMKDKWIEASQLPEGEKVYLKKDFAGWRVISPWRNDNGTINWFNFIFGGKRNLYLLIFLLILAALIFVGIKELISNYQFIADNPCAVCMNSTQYVLNK